MTMSFRELVESHLSEVPPEWMQGRALFGGAPFAAATHVASALVPSERPLRSFQGAFVGPVTGAAEVTAEVIREGRSYTTVEARVVEGGSTRVSVLATYGAHRTGTVSLAVPSRGPGDPHAIPEWPWIEGMQPSFVRYFDLRWERGSPPMSGATEAGFGGWCRHRTDPGDPVTAVLGLVDAWPSPALALMKGPAPASSVTWGLNLVQLPQEVTTDDFFYFEAEVSAVTGGHAHSTGRLWSPQGFLVAESMQLVAVYG